MAARSPILADNAELTGVVVTPLAIDAARYWEAGTHGQHALIEGRTTCARHWADDLLGLSLDGQPRISGLAEIRSGQIDNALHRLDALRL